MWIAIVLAVFYGWLSASATRHGRLELAYRQRQIFQIWAAAAVIIWSLK